MRYNLKPVRDQVIVITGASSGIGLATAQLAAKRGARLVLASRNEHELHRIAEDINSKHGKGKAVAIHVVADVADADQVDRIAETAIREFGGFDTWVNNASVSIFGRLHDTPLIEKRRLFDVNFWGTVHGCRSALKYLRSHGGAIINIGGAASDRSIPMQGVFAASKHAVKAYTDALRMECEEENLPISVSSVKPGSIDTPYAEHARNHLPYEPQLTTPIYAPEVAAEAILECAQKAHRDVYVGSSAKALSFMERFMPGVTDRYMERSAAWRQQSDVPTHPGREDALFSPPPHEGEIRSHEHKYPTRNSYYTTAALHPLRTTLLAAAAIGTVSALFAMGRRTAESSSQRPWIDRRFSAKMMEAQPQLR